MKKHILCATLLLAAAQLSAQKYEGLALTPQMGWNSWNKFADKIDENLIRETADALVNTGLRDAGYIYLNIDDCWHGQRDSLGFSKLMRTVSPAALQHWQNTAITED